MRWPGRSHGAQCLDFDREAPSIDEAILSAIADLARLDDVEVVRIADAGLVSMASIAARTGRTSESVRLLVEGRRGPGAFPPPVTDPRSRHRLWRWSEVDRWFETAVPGHQLDDQEQAVTAINAALEFRAPPSRPAVGGSSGVAGTGGVVGGWRPPARCPHPASPLH